MIDYQERSFAWVLKKRKIYIEFVSVIKDMYEGFITGLRTVVGDIKEFSIIVDLLQGLTLSRTCLPC